MTLDVIALAKQLKSGGTGPFIPDSSEGRKLRALAADGGHIHFEIMSSLLSSKPKSVIEFHEVLIKLIRGAPDLDDQAKSDLTRVIDVIRETRTEAAKSAMLAAFNDASQNERTHPLVLLAASVGKHALSNAPGGGGGVIRPEVWGWDLAATVVAGLLIGATYGAAAGVAGGLVNGAMGSLVAVILG